MTFSSTVINNNKRASYEARSPEDHEVHEGRSQPPSKIAKTKNSHCYRGSSSTDYFRVVDCFTNVYGFAPNEFLPLVPPSAPLPVPALDPLMLTSTLSDDALGKCLFSGYLDTFETVQQASLSKRFALLASTHVPRLDFSRCRELTVSNVQSVVRRFPNLKELDFDYCTQFGSNHLEALLPLAPTLEKLSLKGCSLEGTDVASFIEKLAKSRSVTKLQYLDLSAVDKEDSWRVGDETMKAIANHCPELRTLKAAWCKSITDTGLELLCNAVMEHLEQLNLSLTSLSDKSVPTLQRLLQSSPDMSQLDVSATQISCYTLMEALATDPATTRALKLQQLKLQFLEDLSLASLKRFLASPATGNLLKLDLSWARAADERTTPETVARAVVEALSPRIGKTAPP